MIIFHEGGNEMKKKLGIFLLTFVLGVGTVFGATTKIRVNGQEVKTTVAPIVKGGTTLVPLKVVSEHLGALVEYDSKDKVITVAKGDKVVYLAIGDKEICIYNSDTKEKRFETLAVAPTIVKGTTMVPIRAISSGLDCEFQYNNNIIDITASVFTAYRLTDAEYALLSELESKYGSCSTALGNVTFDYTIVEGKREDMPVDYIIYIEFKNDSITDQVYSTDASSQATIEARTQLKAKMKEIGNYLTGNHPGKKFLSQYDNGFYVDETDENTWVSRAACTWGNVTFNDDLTEGTISEFEWMPYFDDVAW